jgi:Zn-dependent protease with chaperone function
MTYLALATVATFGSFAVVAVCASLALKLTGDGIARRLDRYSAASRAGVLFSLRLLPGVTAIVGAFFIALPIFVVFEPLDTDEPLSRLLLAAASGGLALVVGAAWRALSAWRATTRTADEWLRRSRPLTDLDAPFPAFALEDPRPIVAIVGFRRPQLFVAECVLAGCSVEELRAIVAHECMHVLSHDNIRRFVLRMCPDLVGRRNPIERAWIAAIEHSADDHAAATHPSAAQDLAQALIRIARLAPASAPELASAFYGGGGIERRVRRLLEPVAAPDVPAVFRGSMLCLFGAAAVVTILLSAPAVDGLIEAAVKLLP